MMYHLQKYLVVLWCIILTSICLTSLVLRISPILHSWTKMGMKRAILWVAFLENTFLRMLMPLLGEKPPYLMLVLWDNIQVRKLEKCIKLLIQEVMNNTSVLCKCIYIVNRK